MLALALPGPTVEVKTGFIRRPIIPTITITPAELLRVKLRAAKGPHVVQRPDDRLFNAPNVGDQILKALFTIND